MTSNTSLSKAKVKLKSLRLSQNGRQSEYNDKPKIETEVTKVEKFEMEGDYTFDAREPHWMKSFHQKPGLIQIQSSADIVRPMKSVRINKKTGFKLPIKKSSADSERHKVLSSHTYINEQQG